MSGEYPSRAGRPNILLITCHDLGRHLGCYGVPTVHTPDLDAFASQGVLFTNAFTTAPSCSQSRSSLATGRYPHVNGVMGLAHPPFAWSLAPDEQHAAQILGEAGYDTHLFGLQHVTDRVDSLGFHHLHGFDLVRGCHEKALGARVSERFTEYLAIARPDRPLYIEINLEEPHRPYDQGGALPDEERGVHIPGYLPKDDESRTEMAMLQGAIRQADQAVGRILDALEHGGLAGNTFVIFTADHGLAMPRAKCTLYDAGIETALILRWPRGGFARGSRIPKLISNVDVLPTILEVGGIRAPSNLQGQSFLPLLCGETYPRRTTIYAEKTYHSYYDPMRAVRTQHHKYIRNFESAFLVEVPADVQQGSIFRAHAELYSWTEHPPVELYDLRSDPFEQTNLAGNDDHRDVQRQLDAHLHTWMQRTRDPLLQGPIPSPAWRQTVLDWSPPRTPPRV